MDVYVYKLGNVNYINLTNECTNDCDFCIRKTSEGVGGHKLWLEHEPSARDVIDVLAHDKTDIVFCGFGEPAIKLDELKEIASYVKGYGGHVRLNTNGHASAYHGRDAAKELAGLVDEVSISLNETDAQEYAAITKSRYGGEGFHYMLDFAKKCIECGIGVTLSVVDVLSPEKIEASRKIAESIGADFRIRHYVE